MKIEGGLFPPERVSGESGCRYICTLREMPHITEKKNIKNEKAFRYN